VSARATAPAGVPTLATMLRSPGPWLLDGAMGTLLYDRGIFVSACYDALNRSEPTLITDLHREYVEAGALLLETNTFGANPVKLSAFGLDADTEALNEAGALRAREAAGDEARVLGAVGPLGIRIEPWGPTGREEARGYFARQVRGLLAGGVDGFLLETFQDPAELGEALAAVRSLTDLPVLAQVSLADGTRTTYGADVASVVRKLEEEGADALGFNCSVGPAGILEAVEAAAALTSLPLIAQPNAGFPRTVGDRTMYLASPEYMARYTRRIVEAGARFVGGCCGTTPEHIRRMREALGEAEVAAPVPAPAPPSAPAPAPAVVRVVTEDRGAIVTPLPHRSPLGAALARGRFVTLVELVPPRGWDETPLLEAARTVAAHGVTGVTLPDAPRGLARMGALPSAALLIRSGMAFPRPPGAAPLEVVAHYACRDRNMIGMLSDLLGAAASGIRNLLLVTGDRAPTGPYPDHTAVFDIDAVGLTHMVRRLNEGRDPGGHPVEPPTPFVIGASLNQGAADLEREDRRFRYKVEAGAEYAITQPVFDPDRLLAFLDRHPDHRIPVVAGIWPLPSVASAEFLANEVPGVSVPPGVVERMRRAEARGPEAAREEGIRLAVETVERLRTRISGVHLATPRGQIAPSMEVLRRLGLVEEARA
jgi:methionine synthase I (cobalamin-dependent)/5,10-methylenetetrahydrofolate reductase